MGILKTVSLSKVLPPNRFYLYIDHEGSSYIGCPMFDDHAFCRHISEILRFCSNRSIAEIGSFDLSHTLQKSPHKTRSAPSFISSASAVYLSKRD